MAFIWTLLASLTACGNSDRENVQKVLKKHLLKGTQWTSDFYHYHNNYYFVTDSTGFSQDGQYLWSTPVEPALYNNSRDSIGYENDEPFRYSFKDTVLIIKYLSAGQDTLNGHRVFYLQKSESDKIVFRSDYEYTYGREYLILKKSADK